MAKDEWDDTPKQRRAFYLGTRPWIQPGVEDVGEARAYFLTLVPEYVPDALEQLARVGMLPIRTLRTDSEVASLSLAELTAYGVTSAHLREAIQQWGAGLNLTLEGVTPNWVVTQAEDYLWFREDPRYAGLLLSADERPAGRSATARHWGLITGYEMEDYPVQLPGESDRAFAVRQRNHALSHGWQRPPSVLAEHFVWAVQYQTAMVGVREIAAGAEVTTQNVNAAIDRLLTLVGLTRRADRPGPDASRERPSPNPYDADDAPLFRRRLLGR